MKKYELKIKGREKLEKLPYDAWKEFTTRSKLDCWAS